MDSEPFFGLNPYHLTIAAIGAGVLVAYWLPRFFSGREPAASALLIVAGALAFSLIPGMPAAPDPRTAPRLWEPTSEPAVIGALFGTGPPIDNPTTHHTRAP